MRRHSPILRTIATITTILLTVTQASWAMQTAISAATLRSGEIIEQPTKKAGLESALQTDQATSAPTPMTAPTTIAAGVEELQEGRDYVYEPNGGIRFLQSVKLEAPVNIFNDQKLIYIKIGARTIIFANTLLRGIIRIGEDCEVGGTLTGHVVIGDSVKIHGNSNIKIAYIGDNVHLNNVQLRGYSGVLEGEGHDDSSDIRYVVIQGGDIETRIENSVLETIPQKQAWSFVRENEAPNPKAETLAKYGVAENRTVVQPGAVIRGVKRITNTWIGAGTTIDQAMMIEHSVIGARTTIRPNANITRSYIGDGCNIGSEVSKCWLGDGVVSEHQPSYLSLIAPNEFPIVTPDGRLTTITVPNTTNIAAGTIFANYGGIPDASGKKGLKGTAIVFAGFTGGNSVVQNRYDHPDVALTDLPNQLEVTVLYPITLTKGQVQGTVLPFSYADTVSPKSHKIGWVLAHYDGLINTHLRKGLPPEAIEGFIRLGLKLIKDERARVVIGGKARWTDEQLDAGEHIYRAALDSGKWSPEAIRARAAATAGMEEGISEFTSVEAFRNQNQSVAVPTRTEMVGFLNSKGRFWIHASKTARDRVERWVDNGRWVEGFERLDIGVTDLQRIEPDSAVVVSHQEERPANMPEQGVAYVNLESLPPGMLASYSFVPLFRQILWGLGHPAAWEVVGAATLEDGRIAVFYA